MKTSLANINSKNIIINSSMRYWQRALSVLSLNADNLTYSCVDRFTVGREGASQANDAVERVLSSPLPKYKYSLKFTRGAGVASDAFVLNQKVESLFSKEMLNQNAVVSFYLMPDTANLSEVRAILNTTSVEDDFSDINLTERSNTVLDISQATVGQFDRYIVKVPRASLTNIENGVMLSIKCTRSNGDQFEGKIFGVMIHAGIEAKDFELRSEDETEELDLCQRYFGKSYETDTPVGTVTTTGQLADNTFNNTSVNLYFQIHFKIRMRVIPNFISYSNVTGAANFVSKGGVDTAYGLAAIGSTSASININNTGNQGTTMQWSADAEL